MSLAVLTLLDMTFRMAVILTPLIRVNLLYMKGTGLNRSQFARLLRGASYGDWIVYSLVSL